MHKDSFFSNVKIKLMQGFMLGYFLGDFIKKNILLEHLIVVLPMMYLLNKIGSKIPNNFGNPVTFGLVAGFGFGMAFDNPVFSFDFRSINWDAIDLNLENERSCPAP